MIAKFATKGPTNCMTYRTLGRSGIRVSALSFGTAPLMSRCDRRRSVNALSAAIDHGINHFDTAPSYGQGESERLLGEFFSGRRDDIVLTTKCGQSVKSNLATSAATTAKGLIRPFVRRVRAIRRIAARYLQSQTVRDDLDPGRIEQSVNDSLSRLRTDYVDVLLLHSVSESALRRDETYDSLRNLVQKGKVRLYGVSCNDPRHALVALKRDPTIDVIQLPLNVVDHQGAREVIDSLGTQGVGVIARAPFKNTGLLKETGVPGQGESPSLIALRAIVAQRGVSIMSGALRFVLDQHHVSSVLTSMTSPQHVFENSAVVGLPSLTQDELQHLSGLRRTDRPGACPDFACRQECPS